MKVCVPQIALHTNEAGKNVRILSVDCHPSENVIVTGNQLFGNGSDDRKNCFIGGADNEAKLWQLIPKTTESEKRSVLDPSSVEERKSNLTLKFITTLQGHFKSVNVVRFSPSGAMLATASDDGLIFLYSLSFSETVACWSKVRTQKDVERLTLRGHASDIYALSWSPRSDYLVSGSVDSNVILWKVTQKRLRPDGETKKLSVRKVLVESEDEEQNSVDDECEFEISSKNVKKGAELSVPKGSSDIAKVLSTNEIQKVKFVESFRDHCHFVQGCCFDPFMHYFATQGSDRTCKVYRMKNTKLKDIFQVSKDASEPLVASSKSLKRAFVYNHDISKRVYAGMPSAAASSTKEEKTESTTPLKVKKHGMFVDDSLPSFFRRLSFSPDGSLLVIPSGVLKERTLSKKPGDKDVTDGGSRSEQASPEDSEMISSVPVVYLFRRSDFQNPVCCLQGFTKQTVCVKFCSVLFQRRPSENTPDAVHPWFDGNYRMIFAVLTLNGVFVFDTEQARPIAFVEDLHYAQMTDATWQLNEAGPDSKGTNFLLHLVTSSSDGYLSVLSFTEAELGVRLPKSDYPDIMKDTGSPAVAGSDVPEAAYLERIFGNDRISASMKKPRKTKGRLKKPGATQPSTPPAAAVNEALQQKTTDVKQVTKKNTIMTYVKQKKQMISPSLVSGKKRRVQPTLLATLHSGEEKAKQQPKAENAISTVETESHNLKHGSTPEKPPAPGSSAATQSNKGKRRVEPMLVTDLQGR